jgi:NADH-quinone oxidoreductase subunit L
LDMRKMGGLKGKIPVTFWTFVPATLAIAGIPGFSGFFSKDEILWQAYSSPHGHPLLWAVGVLAAGMTAFYMFRLLFMTFFGECRATEEVKKHIHESPRVMTVPLGVLSVLSIIGGYVGISYVFWGGFNKIGEFLAPVVGGHGEGATGHAAFSLQRVAYAAEGGGATAAHAASTELMLMAISVIIALVGIFIAYVFYIKRPEIPGLLAEKRKTLYTVLVNKYFVDEIYGFFFVNSLKALGTGLWRGFDDVVVDGAVNGVGRVTLDIGGILRKIQTGFVQNYAFSMMIGGLIIIGYYVIRAIFY